MITEFDGTINTGANGGFYLVTCDGWFFAPDGNTYRAVWGRVSQIASDKLLGIKTNMKSTNWYLIVGDDKRGVVIAGCQVHYACACPQPPALGNTTSWHHPSGESTVHSALTPNQIWIAETAFKD